MSDTRLDRFLRGAFKEDELQYLAKHATFQHEKKNTPDTTQGFELLAQVGSLLIRQRDEITILFKRQSENV